MRVMVLFDLPSVTVEERQAYATFRRYLLKSGFLMVQESVYSKLAANAVVANTVIANVKAHAPEKGLVQLLAVTEKQYGKMEVIVGNAHDEVLNSDARLVIL